MYKRGSYWFIKIKGYTLRYYSFQEALKDYLYFKYEV